jgi:hypothetical protein
MDVGLAAVGGAALLAMVAISVWGALTLPPGSRVPLHHGLGGWNNWRSKKVALVAWPGIGVFLYALLLTATSRPHVSGKAAPAVFAPVAMVIIALAYYGAVRAAIRDSGR